MYYSLPNLFMLYILILFFEDVLYVFEGLRQFCVTTDNEVSESGSETTAGCNLLPGVITLK